MAKQTAHDEWMGARERLKETVRAAGIERTLEELNERNAYIMNAEQHFKDERQIVFAIPDLALRRQVIHFNRKCHRLCRANEEQNLRDLQARTRDNGERIRRDYLLGAIIFGIACVSFGNYFLGITGALVGAVVSVLIGFNHIRRADSLAIADAEEARNEIREQETFLSDLGVDGVFSKGEEATGQPDSTDALVQRPR